MEKKMRGVLISFVFLAIAIAGGIPMLVAANAPPPAGPEPYGPGYRNAVLGIFFLVIVSIPTSLISLVLGLLSVKVSRISYVSIVPTASFLIYCGYHYLKWRVFL